VLLTSAPVAGEGVATLPLPLDLHVLSLSLAFILSQDQTLRCCILFLFFSEFVLLETTTLIPQCLPALRCVRRFTVFSTCPWNLDGDLGIPFLVSPVSFIVNLPYRKYFNDLLAPENQILVLIGASKKSLTKFSFREAKVMQR
jgi:hypothetical protein